MSDGENGGPNQYDSIASHYDLIEALPQFQLIQDMVSAAVGDCTGAVILDMGGGSGLHARNAIARGAARVDNVDLSTQLLQRCDAAEQRAGRTPGERVATFLGDASKPFDHLHLHGRDGEGLYDTTLVIWTMDHAFGAELEGMWANVARHTRRGGRFVSIRVQDPTKISDAYARYGVTISDVKKVPGGCEFTYSPHDVEGNKLFSCTAKTSEQQYKLENARAMAKRFGFGELKELKVGEMPRVQKDLGFWQGLMDNPGFVCVWATKES